MNNKAKEHWIRKSSSTCQHKDSNFEESAVPRTDRESRFRTLSEGLFTRSHISGSIVEWDWLCYSKTPGKFYFFYCKLFGTDQNSFITGFNDWKHASEYIGSHERSPNDNNSIRIFPQRSTKKDRMDAKSPEVFESEFKHMKNVLHKVINVAKFLATYGLAFS